MAPRGGEKSEVPGAIPGRDAGGKGGEWERPGTGRERRDPAEDGTGKEMRRERQGTTKRCYE